MSVETLEPRSDPALEGQVRSLHRAIPLYLAVPVAYWAAFRGFGYAMEWRLVGIGALGWWIALVLRAPVGLLARRLREDTARTLMVGVSGPLEEGVRLLVVLLLAPGLSGALAIGLGWASIEVLFAVVNGLVIARLLRRDDEQARKARAMLESQGTLSDAAPWLGVLERVFASLLHVGFTLVVAAAPALALAAALLHSGVNLAVVRLTPRLGKIMVMLAVVSLVVFAGGLALMAGR